MARVWKHTLHCIANQDGSFHIFLSGGEDEKGECKQIVKIFTFGYCYQKKIPVQKIILFNRSLKQIIYEN